MPSRDNLVRAVFLDRDGVINKDVGHLSQVVQLQVLPDAPKAIKRLNDHGLTVVVVTNQSAIGRGICTEDDVEEINRSIAIRLSEDGAKIERFYYCPHHPTEANGKYLQACQCRKPNPGMLLQASRDLGIYLGDSIMVGDQITDLEAGWRAGCRAILVGKDRNPDFWEKLGSGRQPDQVVEGIGEAVDWILKDASLEEYNKTDRKA